jgi:hypothetical protein
MYINDDGDDGDGGDSNDNGKGNSKGNSNDAAAAAISGNVDEDDGGNLRTAIGQRGLDNDNGTMTILWQ